MALYMKFDDGNVKGDVTTEAYKDWINLSSFNFGVGRGISMSVGSMSNREGGLPSISEITVTKMLDPASAMLMQSAMSKSEGVKVEIALVRTGSKEVDEVGKYLLEDVLISGFSVASGGDQPTESLSLSFSKITVDLKGADKANKNGQNVKVGYDLTTGKPF